MLLRRLGETMQEQPEVFGGSSVQQGRPGGYVCNIWTTDTTPADNSSAADTGMREGKFTMIENGTVFRIIDFRPGVQQRIHRTDTIDYIVVMSGEIDMELEAGEEVKLSGFGNFELRTKNQRPGRNPKTGQEIPISARRVVTFRPGQKLRLRVSVDES